MKITEMKQRYKVITQTRGTLFFDKLPKGTYFLQGLQDPKDKDFATFLTYDQGTCLIPILHVKSGKQVFDISRAGEEIK